MMSIRALGNLGDGGSAAKAASHYYSEKSADYYVKDVSPEPEGQWIGKGAEQLGLSGSPEREELQLALAGYVGGRQVQNAGRADRQMGWDVTFSAPKSVSLAWGLADDKTRLAIEDAHRCAAQEAHKYLADQITTRRGYAGTKRERAQLVSAQFTHHTSRAGDPQLHSHIVIPNFCVRPDGTVGTIESKAFYDHKLTAGALYQAELSYRMRDMGYGIEPGLRGTFRVAGVSPKLEELFSKRDKQIDDLAAEREIRTYAGTRGIVLATRPPKQHTTLAERQATWREEARAANLELGLGQERTRSGPQLGPRKPLEERYQEPLTLALGKVVEQNSTFHERDLIREMARSSYGELSAAQIRDAAQSAQEKNLVLTLDRDKDGGVLTTRDMAELELNMLAETRELAKRNGYGADADQALADYPFLSEEQKVSVRSATYESGLAVIQGRAGAGKTTILTAIRQSYERAGYHVQGIALSGQAAHNLEKEAGIQSRTIASWQKEPQVVERTVLIVDEAGMVGSRNMERVLHIARASNAKVILVGDERQLQPIEAGGALHAIDRELIRERPEASSQIQTIQRQKEPWMREAVHEAAKGNTGQALHSLDEQGKMNVYRKAAGARTELVRDYLDKEAPHLERAVILTHRKGDATKINGMVREQLQDRGLVGENKLRVDNGQREIELGVGERVMMTKNEYREIDVRNGQRGRIREIDEKTRTIKVRMDNGQDKKISLDKYHSIDYGYASTTHKAQGMTVDRAYVYGHTKETMASQQATYVQISRAREETRIYAVAGERSIERPELDRGIERELPGQSSRYLQESEERQKAVEDMKKTWGRDAMKDTTLDYRRALEAVREQQRIQEQQRFMELQQKKSRDAEEEKAKEQKAEPKLVRFAGRLAHDPKFYVLPDGRLVAQLTVTTKSMTKDEQGHAREKIILVPVTLRGEQARLARDNLKQNEPVVVEGHLREQEKPTPKGPQKSITVEATKVQSLSQKKGRGGAEMELD
jgi:Ti-type conjugative transfer relaxase TraA